MANLEAAEAIARNAHKGQKRWGGEPYIVHPARVAARMKHDEHKTVAWLHDVVEDTEWTLDQLFLEGFSDSTLVSLNAITHRDGESYANYLRRISNDYTAIIVKIADLTDNLLDLDGEKNRQRREKYEVARLFLQSCI